MSDSKAQWHMTGGCACGRIRYACAARPIVQLTCHCLDCQKASGSAFAAVMMVPSDRLTCTGAVPKHHSVEAASGRTMNREFCGECGAPLFIRKPELPMISFLHVNSLDDPSIFAPDMHFYTSRMQPWERLSDDIPRYQRSAPPEKMQALIRDYFAQRT